MKNSKGIRLSPPIVPQVVPVPNPVIIGRSSTARWLWYTGLFIVAGTIVAIGGIDFGLYLFVGQPATISAWLRVDPFWFWLPAAMMMVFMIGLAVHLFLFGPKKRLALDPKVMQ